MEGALMVLAHGCREPWNQGNRKKAQHLSAMSNLEFVILELLRNLIMKELLSFTTLMLPRKYNL